MNISKLAGKDLRIGKALFNNTHQHYTSQCPHILFCNATTNINGVKLKKTLRIMLKVEGDKVRIMSNSTTNATLKTVSVNDIEVIS